MSLVIMCGNGTTDRDQHQPFIDLLSKKIHQLDSSIEIEIWPDIKSLDNVDCICTWLPDAGVLERFNNLKAIFSLGAGVDHILKHYTPPAHIQLTRIIDPKMATQMAQYICKSVLNITLKNNYFIHQQQKKAWSRMAMLAPKNHCVGIMGLGYLGQKAVQMLTALDIDVIGWSKRKKHIESVECFNEINQLNTFLNRCDIVVSLLPLTPETNGLMNTNRFNQLKDGAHIINVSRGSIINEADLIAALDNNKLSSATLDVFFKEPLAQDNPLWSHPRVMVTPHVSAITNPTTVCHQLVDNYHALQQKQPLQGLVDITKGY